MTPKYLLVRKDGLRGARRVFCVANESALVMAERVVRHAVENQDGMFDAAFIDESSARTMAGSTIDTMLDYHDTDRHCLPFIEDWSNTCAACGVYQVGDPCHACGGIGFHNAGCSDPEAETK